MYNKLINSSEYYHILRLLISELNHKDSIIVKLFTQHVCDGYSNDMVVLSPFLLT